jgi:hypothetical protein
MIMLLIKVLFWTFVAIIIGQLFQYFWYKKWLNNKG